jgi:hypothetical protein
MKAAILYTGLPDNFNINYGSHQSWIEAFDADLYIATWDDVNINRDILPYVNHNRIVNISAASAKHTKQFIEKHISDTLTNKSIYKDALIKCMMGYYTMQLAYRSIALPNQYDMLIRLRFDVQFHTEMKITPKQIMSVSKFTNAVHGWKDRFNYGHPIPMGTMLNVFSNSSSWYIGSTRPNIELLFTDYLHENNILLNNNFNDFSIVKSVNDVRNQHVVS